MSICVLPPCDRDHPEHASPEPSPSSRPRRDAALAVHCVAEHHLSAASRRHTPHFLAELPQKCVHVVHIVCPSAPRCAPHGTSVRGPGTRRAVRIACPHGAERGGAGPHGTAAHCDRAAHRSRRTRQLGQTETAALPPTHVQECITCTCTCTCACSRSVRSAACQAYLGACARFRVAGARLYTAYLKLGELELGLAKVCL